MHIKNRDKCIQYYLDHRTRSSFLLSAFYLTPYIDKIDKTWSVKLMDFEPEAFDNLTFLFDESVDNCQGDSIYSILDFQDQQWSIDGNRGWLLDMIGFLIFVELNMEELEDTLHSWPTLEYQWFEIIFDL